MLFFGHRLFWMVASEPDFALLSVHSIHWICRTQMSERGDLRRTSNGLAARFVPNGSKQPVVQVHWSCAVGRLNIRRGDFNYELIWMQISNFMMISTWLFLLSWSLLLQSARFLGRRQTDDRREATWLCKSCSWRLSCLRFAAPVKPRQQTGSSALQRPGERSAK